MIRLLPLWLASCAYVTDHEVSIWTDGDEDGVPSLVD